MKKISTSYLIIISLTVTAQKPTLTIFQIDSIVKIILTSDLMESLSEGEVRKKNTDINIGGFTNYFYSNGSKELLKVSSRFSVKYYDVDDYYFNEGKLIYIHTFRQKSVKHALKFISEGHYYFHDNICFSKKGKKLSNNINVLTERAKQLQEEFNSQ